MSARRRTFARRLLTRADDAVSSRAPWLSERAYRAVTAPLQAADPVAAARITQARLDDIRERVRAMAASGRVTRADHRRFQRDLARTREDLERLTPRLPALQARILTVRLGAYGEALSALPGNPAVRRATSPRDSLVLGGAAATASAALLLPMAPAAEGGLVAAAASAAGFNAVQRRRERKQAIGAVAEALDAADQATHSAGETDLRTHDANRRELTRRALVSGRLDPAGAASLRRIGELLDTLLVRLVDGSLEPDASHLVQATVTRYLPDTLEPLLSLRDPSAVVGGRPVAVEVGEQLAAIEGGLAKVAERPGRQDPETLLHLQGEFLRSKFGESSL